MACSVVKGLWIGSWQEAEDKFLLQRLGITHVVNATHRNNCFPHEYSYLCIPIHDEEEENMAQYFQEAHRFMKTAIKSLHGNCFVHCMGGISRSATLVLSYLMAEEGMNLHDAYHLLVRQRNEIHPNEGFRRQLIALDVELHGKVSITEEDFKLLSLFIEYEDFVSLEEIYDLYDAHGQDVEALDKHLGEKYIFWSLE